MSSLPYRAKSGAAYGCRAERSGPLSDIAMKLIAKTDETRYQTAAGVERYLRRCSVERGATGPSSPSHSVNAILPIGC